MALTDLQLQQVRYLGMTREAGETLLALTDSSSGAQSNVYPLAGYTDDGVLTEANFASALRAAITACQATGGIVQIPAGQWAPGDEEFVISNQDRDKSVMICGAGMDVTSINFPDAYTGTAFTFTTPGTGSNYNSGMCDLSINCLTANVANTGVGVYLKACINAQFRNVTIRNFAGGSGFKTRKIGVDQTIQYAQLYNFTVTSCDINYDLQNFINCQGYGVYSNAGGTRDYLIDDVKYAIYGGNIQTSAPIAVEASGVGGCRFAVYDFYYEGENPATVLFKFNTPGSTFNCLEIVDFQLGSNPATVVDVDANNDIAVHGLYGAGNAGTILKARNAPNVLLERSGDPIGSPSKFDLDSASRATLLCVGGGLTSFTGGRTVSDKGFTLTAYAQSSEPGSPVTGDLIQNSTTDRPRYRTSTAWQDIGFYADPTGLTDILAPYAVEVFDPAVFRTQSIVSGGLDVLTGVLNGSSASAPAAGQRPTWNASDSYFGGHPSFTCALTGDHFLVGTLAVTIPIGSKAGLFVVYRVPGGTSDPVNRRLAISVEHAADNSCQAAIGQSDLNEPDAGYGYAVGSGFSGFAAGTTGTDAWGHVGVMGSDTATHFTRDLEATATSGNPGLTTSVIDQVHLGSAFNSSVYKGCDITIAYAAVLSSELPTDVMNRAIKAALSKYSLR